MGQNLLTPNTNATASQVSALATSIAALPTTASLSTQSNIAIKSIQRGTTSLINGSTSAGLSISPVNPSKTELRLLGQTNDSIDYTSQNHIFIYLSSTNSIQITRWAGNGNTYLSWELTEFY